MHKRKIFGKVLFLALALSVLVVGTALANSRTVGDTTGVTIHGAQENYWAYTSSSSLKYWLWVKERAWNIGENPLKDEKWDYKNWAYSTNSVGIWDGFFNYGATYVSQHESKVYPYSYAIAFYTSESYRGSGCEASFCWWDNGWDGGCPSTC